MTEETLADLDNDEEGDDEVVDSEPDGDGNDEPENVEPVEVDLEAQP